MKKNLSIIQVILVFSSASILFLAGCSGGGGASFVPGTDVINESGEQLTDQACQAMNRS